MTAAFAERSVILLINIFDVRQIIKGRKKLKHARLFHAVSHRVALTLHELLTAEILRMLDWSTTENMQSGLSFTFFVLVVAAAMLAHKSTLALLHHYCM